MFSELNGKSILITGGTGYFGRKFLQLIIQQYPKVKRVIIYSRNELKQYEMEQEFSTQQYPFLEYVLGDVRDLDMLMQVCLDIDIIIHAAALKQVSTAEVNPTECIKTNVLGSQNVITAAIAHRVKQVIAISTDKAVAPVSVYGASKLCADKLFIAVNRQKSEKMPICSVVRYGNVMGSHASVIPYFMSIKHTKKLPITHLEATRFAISAEDAVNLVLFALQHAQGGEVFIPKIPSFKVLDLAKAICADATYQEIGLRPGEKIHEEMITSSEASATLELEAYYVTLPHYKLQEKKEYLTRLNAKEVATDFAYQSQHNTQWITLPQLETLIKSFQ